jgi:hypothetical protein
MLKRALLLVTLIVAIEALLASAQQLPERNTLIVNSTDTTVYFRLYDSDPASQNAHGTLVELPAREKTVSLAKYMVISKEHAHVQDQSQTGTLLSYNLDPQGRYRIKFDEEKREWFVVQAGGDSPE